MPMGRLRERIRTRKKATTGLFAVAGVLAVAVPIGLGGEKASGTGPQAQAAGTKAITGKLSKPGYTVIALAGSGVAHTDLAAKGKFKLKPPANKVTLHLRAPDGTYSGPVVVGKKKKGKLAIVGVRKGARLRAVKINSKKGYAKPKKKLAEKWRNDKRIAKAKKGVPIGAGVFGRAAVKKLKGPAADPDLDGIPNPLDIDDDGDLILDSSDSDPGGAPAAGPLPRGVVADQFGLQPNLTLYLDQTANANAATLTDERSDAALSTYGFLIISILSGDSVELDCGAPQSRTDPDLGGLAYCSSGGTGRTFMTDAPFPDDFDPDGNGFGNLTPNPSAGAPGNALFLRHGATTAQIGTGDVLIQRVTRSGVETKYPAAMQFVFAAVPALNSFTDGQGEPVTIDYPVAAPNPGTGRGGGPGTRGNPFPVSAGPGGDVILTVTLWRPQRRPIPGEDGYSDPPSAWTDIGGLNYPVGISDLGAGCPQSAFSEDDESLRPMVPGDAFPADYAGLRDLAPDATADPGNTITYSVNMTECLEANGLGASFDEAGEQRGLDFNAIVPNGIGGAQQAIFFERQ
jgi:hypothetical protein